MSQFGVASFITSQGARIPVVFSEIIISLQKNNILGSKGVQAGHMRVVCSALKNVGESSGGWGVPGGEADTEGWNGGGGVQCGGGGYRMGKIQGRGRRSQWEEFPFRS